MGAQFIYHGPQVPPVSVHSHVGGYYRYNCWSMLREGKITCLCICFLSFKLNGR